MKRHALMMTCLCFVMVLSFGSVARAQVPANQLYVLTEIVVEPAKATDLEAAMKDWVAFYAKNKYPWPYTIYRTEDFHYYVLAPVKDMADSGEMMKIDMELAEKGGPEFEGLMKRTGGAYAFMNSGMTVARYDLSYAPEKPRVTTEEARFICWDYYYGLPGREKEAEKIAKEWQALYKSKNIPDGFQVWMLVMGPDLPLLVAARWGKNQADFNAAEEELLKTMGDAYTALAKKTMGICRKYERRMGYRLDGLSYAPAAK